MIIKDMKYFRFLKFLSVFVEKKYVFVEKKICLKFKVSLNSTFHSKVISLLAPKKILKFV